MSVADIFCPEHGETLAHCQDCCMDDRAEHALLQKVESCARDYVAAHAYVATRLQGADYARAYAVAARALDDALTALDRLRSGK